MTNKDFLDLFEKASNAYDTEDYVTAFRIYSGLYVHQPKDVINNLAILYEFGFGVEQDIAYALKLYKHGWRLYQDICCLENISNLYDKQGHWRQACYWWKKGIALDDGACALAYAEALIKRQSKDHQKIKQLLIYASEHENMSEDDWQTADYLLKEMSK